MGWVVALDFGTTATAAAVSVDGGPVSELVMPSGGTTVSSSVFAEDDGWLVVGADADNEAEMRLDAYEPTPKRRVSDPQVHLGAASFAPAELIGAVLAPVIGEALRQHNNTAPTEVVMTHPWSWRAPRKRVLRAALDNAAERLNLAQLPEPMFLPEPVAAARWYARGDAPGDGSCFAVYDLGGGTFDTTVLRATADGGYEVLSSGGLDPLGGFDFDQLLFDYLGRKYVAAADSGLWAGLSAPGQTDPDLARQHRQLQERVRRLKEALSQEPEKRIRLPGVRDQVLVTRGEYEDLIREHVNDTVTELEDTIAEAGLEPQMLTAIYRIGGAARTPLVGAALDGFHLPVRTTDHPKLVVAQGAATRPPPPAVNRSQQLFEAATAARDRGDLAAALADLQQVVALDDPHWAPLARAQVDELTRIETETEPEPSPPEPDTTPPAKKSVPPPAGGSHHAMADRNFAGPTPQKPGRAWRLTLALGVLVLVVGALMLLFTGFFPFIGWAMGLLLAVVGGVGLLVRRGRHGV